MPEPDALGLVARVRRSAGWRLSRAEQRSRSGMRRATADVRVLPTFLVIGAQKAGTTSLHEYLRNHPAVLTATVKEVQYFNKEYWRGERWYRSQFPLAARATAVRRQTGVAPQIGEATAAYLFDPRVPARVQRLTPAVKLVAVMRDPVERAYSHYQMELRWGRETVPFEEALLREAKELPNQLQRIARDPLDPNGFACSYVARGRYAEQLERWLALFPREQLLVVVSEELRADPAAVTAQVFEFLGVPADPRDEYPLRGMQTYAPMASATRRRLEEAFADQNAKLEALLGRALPWFSRMRDDEEPAGP